MRDCEHNKPHGECEECREEREKQIAGPVSYKQFCSDNLHNLVASEMRFEYIMVYLPQFPGFDPLEIMQRRVYERAKGKVHVFDHTAKMEDFTNSPHIIEAIVIERKTPCGAITNRVVTNPKRVTCKACLEWLEQQKGEL